MVKKRDFRSWLEKQNRRNDPIGDLSRDLADDECCEARDWQGIREHLHSHSAISEVHDALNSAVVEWGDNPYAEDD